MPANPTAAKNMLLSTDYPLDQVVYMTEGSFTVGAGAFTERNVAHGLPFIPLPLGSWTTSANWSVSYEYYSGPPASNPALMGPFTYDVRAEANATNVKVTCFNYSGSSVTIRYRVYCFEPSDSNAAVPPTALASNQLVFSTDFNYTKLFMAGILNQPASSGTFTKTIVHGLGYRPQVMSWTEIDGIVRIDTMTASPQVTSVSLIYHFNFPTNLKKHYRIYLDE